MTAPAGGLFERAARVLVILSALAGLVVEMWLGQREWALLGPLTAGAGVGALLLARRAQAWAFAIPLSVAFIVPVLFQASIGRFLPSYHVIWFAAMLGAVIGGPGAVTSWSIPARWRLPLVFWALLLAVAWPLVVAREADFTWAWLTRGHHMANSGVGGPPPVIAVWMINAALTVLTGLLWFDRMFVYADEPAKFRRFVVMPLACGMALACALAIYQGLVDVVFLSDHQWPVIRRAGGGLIDGDAFGAAAGFWATAFMALALSGGWTAAVVGSVGVLLAWGGLWATGSRMALLAGLVGVGVALAYAARGAFVERQGWRVVAGVAVLASTIGAAALGNWTTASPLQRVRESIPEMSRPALKEFVRFELFNRGAPYGTASVMMVRESPLVGVGIGSFNVMFPDYSYRIESVRRNPDNAQSWFRQQLAEEGLLGSAGWLLWLPSVAWLLCRTGGSRDTALAAGMIKGALLAMAIVTSVSLPTQETFVALMPWLLVFWYLQLSPDARARVAQPTRLAPAAGWGLAWCGVVVFAALTLRVGWTEFRPPLRAVRADWPFTAGFHDLETPADRPAFQWTEGRAIQVFPIAGPWLKLTVRGGSPDVATRPARLTVWRSGRRIIDVTRTTNEPETWYVASRAGEKQMMLEFGVSPTWRPSAPGSGGDERELGVAVDDWTFVAAPPPGATVIR